MKPKSNGLRARRSLTFEERPYAGKTFYVDVKSASAKSKISHRIQNLGGQIENFLSKDLSLLISDKNSTRLAKDDCSHSQKQAVKNVPLSRGQALLLKASTNQNCDSNNSNGLLQSATNLGIQIETPAGFLRESSKFLGKLKTETPSGKLDTSINGMTTITWDSEKENSPLIKVEDEDGLYRPLFKQFEAFPQIFYNETGSPFDVGVVLTKVKESNNQSKRKSVGGALRGGYCESCDHWYKCSLREHLNSEKHKEFVSVSENFKSLNNVSSSLPNLQRFVGKYGLNGTGHSPQVSSDTQNSHSSLPRCEFDQNLIRSRLSPGSEENRNSKELEAVSFHEDKYSDIKQKVRCRRMSKTEPILDRSYKPDYELIPNTQPVKLAERCQVPTKHVKMLNVVKNCRDESVSEKSNRSIKACMSQKMGQMFSVDDVIKSVTENEDYFSSGDDNEVEDHIPKTACIITKHRTSETCTSPISNPSLPSSKNRNANIVAEDVKKQNVSSNDSTRKSKKSMEGDSVRFQNIPMMHFSSSSFGDNGVNNVISLLNSQHSRKSCDREGFVSKRLSGEENSAVEASCSGNSSWALEKLSDISDCRENVPVVDGNMPEQFSIANGNILEHLIDEIDDSVNDMPVLEAVTDLRGRGTGFDLMPALDSYDSEDMDTFCKSVLNEDRGDKSQTVLSVPLPEYSNITEESLQDKPQIGTFILAGNLQTNHQVPVTHLRNDVKDEVKLETPDKLNNLKSKIYENQANSGSTIRNWLLPNDDSGSVRSPGNVNTTLVNTSCNIPETPPVESSNAIENMESSNAIENISDDIGSLNDIKETADSSKVADWIQRQNFVVAENLSESSQQSFKDSILDPEFLCSIDKKKENDEHETSYFKDLKSCSEKRYGSEKADIDDRSNVWSESGTSISDCTLDNFRIGGGQENNGLTGVESTSNKETVKENVNDILKLDEMSQDSDISAKTGLASVVTARGIKITGLSSLSSHFFNATESDVFTETETSTIAYGSSRKNSEYSVADQINKTVPTAGSGASKCQQNVVNCQIGIKDADQICNTDIDNNITLDQYKLSGAKTNVVENSISSQKKTNSSRSTKSDNCVRNKSQTKARKPRATKASKSKKQSQTHNLLNQVLTSNLYSPVSSSVGNSATQNQTYCQSVQKSPYTQNIGQGNLPSSQSHHQQGFGHFQQDYIGDHGLHHGINAPDPYSQSHGEFRMMDLLLSPGQQVHTFHPPAMFQQNLTNQQQGVCHQTQVSSVTQQNNGYLSNLTQQNINHQFGVLPFSQVYHNQNGCQSNKENNHHFLSSGSNFFMHNWNTGSSVNQLGQSTHQVPGNHSHYPGSPGNRLNDHSVSNGSLQTIEMSHIADSNSMYENNFNFKIADTRKLKNNSNGSVKSGQPKDIKQINKQKNSTTQGGAISSNVICEANSAYKNLTTQPLSHLNSHCVPVSHNNHPENLNQNLPSSPVYYAHQNPYVQAGLGSYQNLQLPVNYNHSQGINSFSPGYYDLVQKGSTDMQANMYNTVQTGDTKITIRRVPAANPAPANKQPKHDLMQYWNVRKAGDCRLVFSANMITGKRKAEEETPTKLHMSNINSGQNVQPDSKRRKCLVY